MEGRRVGKSLLHPRAPETSDDAIELKERNPDEHILVILDCNSMQFYLNRAIVIDIPAD